MQEIVHKLKILPAPVAPELGNQRGFLPGRHLAVKLLRPAPDFPDRADIPARNPLILVQQDEFLTALHQGNQAGLKSLGGAHAPVINPVRQAGGARPPGDVPFDKAPELQRLGFDKERGFAVPGLIDAVLQRPGVSGLVIVEIGAWNHGDLFTLNQIGVLPQKDRVGIGLIGGAAHDAMGAAGEGAHAVQHFIIHLFRLIPLLQLDDEEVGMPGPVRANDHKIHPFGGSGNLIFNGGRGVLRNSGVVQDAAHKVERVLPGAVFGCGSAR